MASIDEQVRSRLIFALDFPSRITAREFIRKLAPYYGTFKIGLEAIHIGFAAELARVIRDYGRKVFWDAKFNEHHELVDRLMEWLCWNNRVDHVTFHISGGEQLRQAMFKYQDRVNVLGLTVLSTFADSDAFMSYGSPVNVSVLRFATLFKRSGGTGVVCAPGELELLGGESELLGLQKIVTGIRPSGSAAGGHNPERVGTPAEAIKRGAHMLVLGRAVSQSPKPVDVSKAVSEEVQRAIENRQGE
ncbi:MAG: orotidine 5'-phosphate decarboxylase [Candidatus Sungiibacteriota bacterium]|uniref:Orotidine 5'-phosphate decarboxylase n=1 Tax=Candidatus Sungiibacteriota bacterium TaxID=2750080 RepID=A0A7T5RJM1_9BACT|nr:MAG: orotidine 5'-phosphate decarboxylase [Candidatus Sungbacteria bacterium]